MDSPAFLPSDCTPLSLTFWLQLSSPQGPAGRSMTLATGPLRRQVSGFPPLYLLSSLFSLVKCEPACDRLGALPSGPFKLSVPEPDRWWALWVGRLSGFTRVPLEAQSSSGGGTQSVQPQTPNCCRPLSTCHSFLPWYKSVFSPLSSFPGRASAHLCPAFTSPASSSSPGAALGESLDCNTVALLIKCRKC